MMSSEKSVFLGIARLRGGGGVLVADHAKFLALFQEVLFWSITGIHFFKNANVLNFELFFKLFKYLPTSKPSLFVRV